MRNRLIFRGILLFFTISFFSGKVWSQTTDALGTFTPYSIFGVGDLAKQGNAMNLGMGGIGIGVRNRLFINYLNPASITQRDTMSFMLDFGLEQKNIYNNDGNTKSAYNVFNMHNLVITSPIYKKSALILGITPFSDIGYKFEETETDPAIVAQMGDVKYRKYGTGGLSRAFVGASMMVAKNLSIGAEAAYYFGTIDRYSTIVFNSGSSYKNINTGMDYVIGGYSAKFGMQYSKSFKEYMLTLGATYSLKSKLTGDLSRYAISESVSGVKDTIYMNTLSDPKMSIPSELSIGFSLRKGEKWMFGADYSRQDWSNISFVSTPGVDFKTSAANSIKAGFEYTPNRYDIRYYFRRCTYRGGVYYDESYFTLGGNKVNAVGITLGMNLPVYQLNNAIGVAVDFGQRGGLKNSLVRERYVKFVINIHLHDMWFKKFRYD